MFHSVFISYAGSDRAFALNLHELLQGRGVRSWIDVEQLLPGDDILDGIEFGIGHWDKVLLCASREALTSGWVEAEIDRALAKERQLMNERRKKTIVLIPLMLDDYFLAEWAGGKATQLKSRKAADFRRWRDQDFDLAKSIGPLVRALSIDGTGREPPPRSMLI